MGQQQLLFIVLGVILVGVAIIVGISYFQSSAIETKRNYLIADCVNLAALAQQYYMRPTALGGGGRKFTGWSIPSDLTTTSNGSFAETIYSDSVVIIAIGNEVATNNDSVKVKFSITSTTYNTTIIN